MSDFLKEMGIFSGEATLSKLFCLPFEKKYTIKKIFSPLRVWYAGKQTVRHRCYLPW